MADLNKKEPSAQPVAVKPDDVVEVLTNVYDPELQMNIVALGLVYGVDVKDGNRVTVRMTLTFPGCPYGPELVHEVESTVSMIRGVKDVIVDVVWEPPWSPDKMSEEARLELGLDV